ncbi:MAG: hypothetical protein CMK33_04070, partial [Porticoccaceae bacterium]|nr:hypothetical protein [Porticoccaceae bacterium]
WFFRGLPVAPESDAWGQLGDFFGGVLNPAFSFLALLALLMTLYVQSRELKLSRQVAELSREELELTREELKNSAEALAAQNDAIHDQRFEQTFFSWFESYRSLVEDIHDVPRGGSRGRDALNAMHGNYMSGYAVLFKAREIGLLGYVPEGDWIQQIRKMPSEDHEAFRNAYMEAREDFFRLGYREQLRAPFATLAALLDWICSQDRFTSDKKQLYFGLVASHLSWIEGYFVFLACVGDEWPGLRRLVNESGILRKFDWRADPCMPIVWPLLESVFVRPPKWDAAVVMP